MDRVLVGLAILAGVATASAQAPAALTPEDRSEIQALAASYAEALGECDAEGFAQLFVPETGYFASGFRGHIFGHERLIALVESERHCIPSAGTENPPRRGGRSVPTVALEVTPTGVKGIADLGAVGEYQDEYAKTPEGWRFASRTVVIPAEKEAGLDAGDMLAIRQLSGDELGDHYVADQNGTMRLRSSGVALSVENGTVKGRAYLKDGSYYDDVYEKTGSGEWRIRSRTHVAASTP